jgi:hypothetical protein
MHNACGHPMLELEYIMRVFRSNLVYRVLVIHVSTRMRAHMLTWFKCWSCFLRMLVHVLT